MLRAIRRDPPLDIREFIIQTWSTPAVDGREVRPRPDKIEALYRIDESAANPVPQVLARVDDQLTVGTHFRAAISRLAARFPGVPVVGLFIARRAPNTTDVEDFGDDDR